MRRHDTILCRYLRQDSLRGEDGHVAITAQGGGVAGEEEAIFVAVHDGFLRVWVRCGDGGGAGDEDDESVKRDDLRRREQEESREDVHCVR